VRRAANANKTFTKAVCGALKGPEGTCLASSPGPCHRLTEHRVRCSLNLTLEFEDKSQARCEYLVEWSIKTNSPNLRAHLLGVRACKQVKPPEPAPQP
jgi:hypothetical protein